MEKIIQFEMTETEARFVCTAIGLTTNLLREDRSQRGVDNSMTLARMLYRELWLQNRLDAFAEKWTALMDAST
jgi:hypothetical protein